MKYAILAAMFWSTAAFAQRPQMTWDGYVDGSATLYIQGRNVDAQGRTTGAVDRPRFRFNEPLPASPLTVEVRVRRGRGNVEVVEQPSRRNDFSAVVQIDTRNFGPENYSLDFYWDNARQSGRGRGSDSSYSRGRDPEPYARGGGNNTNYGSGGSATWSGTVDEEALLLFRGRQAFTTAVRGQRVGGERVDFTDPLPRREVTVRLENPRGRGRTELLEQPTADNNYTAKVRIIDEEGGAGSYSFALTWDRGETSRPSSNTRQNDNNAGVLSPEGGAPSTNQGYGRYSGGNVIRWSGRVDNRVQVVVEGDRVRSQRLEGAPISNERVDVGSPLPNYAVGNLEIQKIRGRGEFRILEQPSGRSGSRLVFEIRDPDGGADDYEVEIRWP